MDLQHTEPAIRLSGVSKRFGAVTAVDHVDLAVFPGEVFGLLGPNGAGKTTTIDMVMGLARATQGSVRVFGIDPTRQGLAVRKVTGVVMQQSASDLYLTGRENVRLYAALFFANDRTVRQRAEEVLEWAGLTTDADRLVKTYSGGMRRRLDLAISALHRPKLLLLDEPTVGLDVQTRQEVWSMTRDMAKQGTTVLLTTHYLEEADRLCNRVAIMDRGKLIALDTPEQLRKTTVGDLHRLSVRLAEPCNLTSLDLPSPARTTKDGLVLSGAPDKLWRSLALLQAAHGDTILEVSYSAPTLDDVFLRLTQHAKMPAGSAP